MQNMQTTANNNPERFQTPWNVAKLESLSVSLRIVYRQCTEVCQLIS